LIKYEKDDSPEIYVGSGNIQQRWQSHRKRLSSLGAALPGGRYEVWVFRDERYRMIEADTLLRFKEYYGSLPLLNQRLESPTDTKARSNIRNVSTKLQTLIGRTLGRFAQSMEKL
jgi:hypothetical protein